MKIALIGPITSTMRWDKDKNLEALRRAAKWLRRLGHEVWCPAEYDDVLPVDVESRPWPWWMRRSIPHVCEADVVVSVGEVKASRGAGFENAVALNLMIPVIPISSFAEEHAA